MEGLLGVPSAFPLSPGIPVLKVLTLRKAGLPFLALSGVIWETLLLMGLIELSLTVVRFVWDAD